jgi:hypothetical protein
MNDHTFHCPLLAINNAKVKILETEQMPSLYVHFYPLLHGHSFEGIHFLMIGLILAPECEWDVTYEDVISFPSN